MQMRKKTTEAKATTTDAYTVTKLHKMKEGKGDDCRKWTEKVKEISQRERERDRQKTAKTTTADAYIVTNSKHK